MNRKEAYEGIKRLNLQDKIKKLYGRNFTQVSTDKLEKIILANTAKKVDNVVQKSKEHNISNVKKSPFQKLVEILHKKRILLDSEYSELL